MNGRSLRRSIDAFCRWCIYDPKAELGIWREQWEACPSRDCPLWTVRPTADRRWRARCDAAANAAHDQRSMTAPLREVVERVGRHAVRLSCGHVETLAAGEADAIGRRPSCERCTLADGDDVERES